jgi:integrase
MINIIFKPKGSRIWRWKFRQRPEDGKILDVSLGTSDKQAAEIERSKLLREKLQERAGLIPAKAFREAAQLKLANHLRDFIGDLQAKGRNGQYVAEFENRITLLMSQCGWQAPQDMTADSFVKWRSSSQDRSPKTLNEYLICAKGFANWLTAQGRIAVNLLASVRKVETRGREVRPRRAYNDSEFAALLSVAGAQRIVYLTAAFTGIRHGELKELRWSDINLLGEKPSVTVRASVSKNHKQACLPLHPALVEALLQFRPANATASDLVFKRLVPRSKIFNAHLEAAKIAKVDAQKRVVDFHSLRHTFCTNLHRAGVSQREAMELMRHNDPRLTAKTYTDASLLQLGSAVEKLACPASQIASQISGAAGHSVTSPVAKNAGVKSDKTLANKGELSLFDAACLVLSNIQKRCAIQGSNL